VTREVEAAIELATSGAMDALVRAGRAERRAERFESLVETGQPALRELNMSLAHAERRTAERHLACVRIQEAHAHRLTRMLETRPTESTMPSVVAAATDLISVKSAALTMYSTNGALAALVGTDARARAAQDLELTIGQGPATEAATTHRDVTASAGTLRARWPDYARGAETIGIHAVTAVDLRIGDDSFGSLAIYDDAFTETTKDLAPLHGVADGLVETILVEVDATHAGQSSFGLITGDRAYVLHNAAGVLSVQTGCDVETALMMIRARAWADGSSPIEVARMVLNGEVRLGEGGASVL
jgi:hypothetical protein